MPICHNCNNKFPNKAIIDEKEVFLHRRKYCLECNPFGEHRFHNGKRTKTKRGKRVLLKNSFICKECGKKRNQKTRNRVCSTCRSLKQRHEKRKKALKLLEGKCLICRYDKCVNSLDFHHLDESKKTFNLSRGWDKSWEILEKEIKKCILLCRNCHGEYHAKQFCLLTDKPR